MDITAIGTLFEQGGWGLVLAGVVLWIGRALYTKLSAKFEELSKKIDELKDEVTELKVDSTKWKTAIRACEHSDCRAKQLLDREEGK